MAVDGAGFLYSLHAAVAVIVLVASVGTLYLLFRDGVSRQKRLRTECCHSSVEWDSVSYRCSGCLRWEPDVYDSESNDVVSVGGGDD